MEPSINKIPLYLLPPTGFVAKYCSTISPQIVLGERFEKQTYRSRFEIAGPNGKQILSVPLIHKSTHASMAEMQIDYSQNWNIKQWRSIETAYHKAPFFEYYAPYIEALLIILKILKQKQSLLLTYNSEPTISSFYFSDQPNYHQVFIHKNGFIPNLSILDLIFNEGPLSTDYIVK